MGRVLLVTGASSGIGAACARMGASRSDRVIVHYNSNRAGAEETAEAARAAGAIADIVQADLSDTAAIAPLFREVAELAEADRPLHFVNNAGIVDDKATVSEMSAERLTRMFTVNVVAAFLCAKEAVTLMRRGGGGGIVNISSRASVLGSAGQFVDYAASKAAIDTFTLGLADELAPEGIRVNAVRPGLIETEIHAKGGDPDRVARLVGNVPMGHAGTPEDVARGVLWLLSEDAAYVTRHLLDVSGGR